MKKMSEEQRSKFCPWCYKKPRTDIETPEKIYYCDNKECGQRYELGYFGELEKVYPQLRPTFCPWCSTPPRSVIETIETIYYCDNKDCGQRYVLDSFGELEKVYDSKLVTEKFPLGLVLSVGWDTYLIIFVIEQTLMISLICLNRATVVEKSFSLQQLACAAIKQKNKKPKYVTFYKGSPDNPWNNTLQITVDGNKGCIFVMIHRKHNLLFRSNGMGEYLNLKTNTVKEYVRALSMRDSLSRIKRKEKKYTSYKITLDDIERGNPGFKLKYEVAYAAERQRIHKKKSLIQILLKIMKEIGIVIMTLDFLEEYANPSSTSSNKKYTGLFLDFANYDLEEDLIIL